MPTFANQVRREYVIRRWPLLRLATGASLAVAGLVPVIYERFQPPYSRSNTSAELTFACICLLTAVAISRWQVYRLREGEGRLSWFSASWLKWRSGTIAFQDIGVIELDQGSRTARLFGPRILLHRNSDPAAAPVVCQLGWVSRPTADQIRAAMELRIRGKSTIDVDEASPARRAVRFSLRSLFVVTVIVAVVLAILRVVRFPPAASCLLAAYAVVLLAGWRRSRIGGYTMVIVLVESYAPLFWVFPESAPWGHTSGMLEFLPLAPSEWLMFIPGLRNGAEWRMWTSAFVALVQFLGLSRLAQRGPWWMLVVAIGLLVTSSFFSLIIHALFRA